MEYWGLKMEFILILNSVLQAVSKKRFNPFEPIIPIFQYSIIPRHRSSAQPISSELDLRIRFSTLEIIKGATT